jgi:hypothetical protein
VRLGKIEALSIAYFRRTGIAPDVAKCDAHGGLVTLRDAHGSVLVEIADGITAEAAMGHGSIGFAAVEPFRFAIRCHWCGRRTARGSDTYIAGEVWECPRCHCGNVSPKDPLAASRE